ncbi:GTP 3',8-cyclase MoaA [Bacteriovoracaceae bacterium]|nr:GTP 3',8-cyclase MoaA [Bacteriovoracaceae bacterium]
MNIEDKYGRSFKKLRISLLDACNYKCVYCMPEGSVKFVHQKDWLTGAQITEAVRKLQANGIEEVRFTGGEPTLRSDFVEIIESVSKLPLKKIGITTNGHHLYKYLRELKEKTKLTSINISLDSLQGEKFKRIAQIDGLDNVLRSIALAKELGFDVKVNTVIINSLNNDEILDFVEFAAEHKVDVRFLELMKIGVMKKHFHHYFLSADEIINMIKEKHSMHLVESAWDSTSFNYHLDNGSKIGFIASETKAFCTTCTRLRMGPKGDIRPCIMLPESISIKDRPDAEIPFILKELLKEKPIDRIESQDQNMFEIGG